MKRLIKAGRKLAEKRRQKLQQPHQQKKLEQPEPRSKCAVVVAT
jgi:hypothetical protein